MPDSLSSRDCSVTDPRHTQYLNAMGIAIWRQRPTTPSLTANAEIMPVRVVIEHSAPVELGVGEAGSMLAKLLKAVQLDDGDFVLEQIQQASEFESGDQRTLAFVTGAETAGQQLGLPTLQQMMDDRANKKIAWDRLKPWVGRLR